MKLVEELPEGVSDYIICMFIGNCFVHKEVHVKDGKPFVRMTSEEYTVKHGIDPEDWDCELDVWDEVYEDDISFHIDPLGQFKKYFIIP